MRRLLFIKSFIFLIAAFALIVVATPVVLYEVGLANIKGRPEPPIETSNIVVDTAFFQETFKNRTPIMVPVLNPWSYIYGVVTADANALQMSNGSSALWVVARDYANTHLKNRRRWTLASAALMIWVSRHWTTDQVVTAAAAIARKYPDHDLGHPVVN